jgi:hypothetical protein
MQIAATDASAVMTHTKAPPHSDVTNRANRAMEFLVTGDARCVE